MKWPVILFCIVILMGACQNRDVKEEVKDEDVDIVDIEANEEDIEKVEKEVSIWEGQWTRTDHMNNGILEISNETNNDFEFVLNVSSGANIGFIEGKAMIEENKARFSSEEYGELCEVYFDLNSDRVIVSTNDSCEGYGGMGTYFEGEFIKGEEEEQEISLLDLNVITNEKIDKAFKDLVGDDYQLFIEIFQLVNQEEDIDGFQSEVYTGGVRGLFTIMEAVIMYNEKGQIWAAAIDNDKVNYYTNVEEFKEVVPKTIKKWHERFEELPFEYK